MKYTVSKHNVHIVDSYKVRRRDFRQVLEGIRSASPESEVWKRPIGSLRREWACHNAAYRLGFKRSRTKDVDLNHPQGWKARVTYSLLGPLALIIIK